MAFWKKLIYSGSNAQLANLYASNAVTASYFSGNGALVTGVVSSSFAVSSSLAVSASFSRTSVSSSYSSTSVSSSYAVSASYAPSSGGGSTTVISTSSLSTDQHNWNPTGLSTATVIRISSSTNLLMITGITAPSVDKELTLVNTGSYTVLLTSDDESSTAANRFTFGRDGALFPNRSVKLLYDLTSARWRMVDKISEEYSNARATRHKYVFSQNLFSSYGSVSIAANGGITLSAATATLPNGVAGTTGTTNGNFVSFRIGNATYTSGNVSSSTRTSVLQESYILTPASLADATTNYTIMAGIGASDNSTTGQGFRLQYNYNVNGGKWQGITNNGSSATVDTGITVAASTVYKLTAQCRPDNSVAFWINDVYVGETTTNFPTQPIMSETLLKLSTGGTSRTLECYSVEMVQIR